MRNELNDMVEDGHGSIPVLGRSDSSRGTGRLYGPSICTPEDDEDDMGPFNMNTPWLEFHIDD